MDAGGDDRVGSRPPPCRGSRRARPRALDAGRPAPAPVGRAPTRTPAPRCAERSRRSEDRRTRGPRRIRPPRYRPGSGRAEHDEQGVVVALELRPLMSVDRVLDGEGCSWNSEASDWTSCSSGRYRPIHHPLGVQAQGLERLRKRNGRGDPFAVHVVALSTSRERRRSRGGASGTDRPSSRSASLLGRSTSGVRGNGSATGGARLGSRPERNPALGADPASGEDRCCGRSSHRSKNFSTVAKRGFSNRTRSISGFSWSRATANRTDTARTDSYSWRVKLIGSVHRGSSTHRCRCRRDDGDAEPGIGRLLRPLVHLPEDGLIGRFALSPIKHRHRRARFGFDARA